MTPSELRAAMERVCMELALAGTARPSTIELARSVAMQVTAERADREERIRSGNRDRKQREREAKRSRGGHAENGVTSGPGHGPDRVTVTVTGPVTNRVTSRGQSPSALPLSDQNSSSLQDLTKETAEEREESAREDGHEASRGNERDSLYQPDRALEALAKAWNRVGLLQLSPTDRPRLERIRPLLKDLAVELGKSELELFTGAVRCFRADPDTVRKNMVHLAVLCAQLENWVRAAFPTKPRGRYDSDPDVERRMRADLERDEADAEAARAALAELRARRASEPASDPEADLAASQEWLKGLRDAEPEDDDAEPEGNAA